ncbi:hypothetical protein RDI58_030056 [Solanum bulbocastanum]|uniref:Uncharacterized protein n=1 Tax=Solanum bulbocastanum TaxID=147425 RepID=A0AAN8SZH6_SOLBU
MRRKEIVLKGNSLLK